MSHALLACDNLVRMHYHFFVWQINMAQWRHYRVPRCSNERPRDSQFPVLISPVQEQGSPRLFTLSGTEADSSYSVLSKPHN